MWKNNREDPFSHSVTSSGDRNNFMDVSICLMYKNIFYHYILLLVNSSDY